MGSLPSETTSVAVIGLSCRFPGDATDPENFWKFLCDARSAYSKPNRFDINGFHSPIESQRKTSAPSGAHFLRDDIGLFDAGFFSISPNEAQAMDPQQKIMLEVAYEAFENAGLTLESIAGSNTACHIGNFTTDYREILFRDPESAPSHSVSGSGSELVSNRLSWFFDLRGPSFTLNTACSSSLVALHQSCQSLRTGESDMALVGGSNLLLNPDMFLALSKQQFLAKDGRSKAFDSRGDGYGRGEGFAAVVLKRLDDAVRDLDPIRAVIRGTGVNQDGKTKAIMVPSAEAQEKLIRSTYTSAGLSFRETNYFEAHGTGTKVGDPLELEAISKTLGSTRNPMNKIIVGSVKSNIGHLESTAGLAGFIKGVYMLERGAIPPNIHFQEPNPRIPFEEWNIAIPTKMAPWPVEGLRRLSVQGFGYGGTNAHAILDDAYHYLAERNLPGIHFTKKSACINTYDGLLFSSNQHFMPKSLVPVNGFVSPKTRDERPLRLFVLSAQDQDGLERQYQSLLRYAQDRLDRLPKEAHDLFLRDLSFTLGQKRSRLAWRACFTASSKDDLLSALDIRSAERICYRPSGEPRLGFIFTGQGAQWARMGAQLFQYQVFRESVQDSDSYLRNSLGCSWSAVDEVLRHESESFIHLPAYSQPLCSILQIALVDLLETWNIMPSAVAGHSSGEIAAAYCLGALNKRDALKVAYYRGMLSAQMKVLQPDLHGAMMATAISEEQAQDRIAKLSRGHIVTACVNSPSSVTISGDVSAIEEMQTLLKKEGIFARKLNVETAYHSPHMETISMQYLDTIRDIQIQPVYKSRKMFSAVTGDRVDPSELGAMYWVRNLMSPVLFYDATLDLLRSMQAERRPAETSSNILLEIGPHSALKGPVIQTLKNHSIDNVAYHSVLSRGRNAVETALGEAGALLSQGIPVDMVQVNRDANTAHHGSPQPLIDIPSYKWNHSRSFWTESRVAKEYRFREYHASSLLGAPCPAHGETQKLWRGMLKISDEDWIRDHKIQSSMVYPAAGYITMVVEAAFQIASKERVIRDVRLREVQVSSPAVLEEDSELECILQLRPHLIGTRENSSAWMEFSISTSVNGQSLKQNCSGLLLLEYEISEGTGTSQETKLDDEASKAFYKKVREVCHTTEDSKIFYKDLAASGLVYGPAMRNVSRVQYGSGTSHCSVDVPDHGFFATSDQNYRTHVIHPATLDPIFHAVVAAHKNEQGHLKQTIIPMFIGEITISASTPFVYGTRLVGVATASQHGAQGVMAEVVMLDEQLTRPVLTVKDFQWEALTGTGQPEDQESENTKIFSRLTWKPAFEFFTPTQQKRLLEAVSAKKDAAESIEDSYKMEEKLTIGLITRVLDHASIDTSIPNQLQGLYEWMRNQQSLLNDLQETAQEPVQPSVEAQDFKSRVLLQVIETVESFFLNRLGVAMLDLEDILMNSYLTTMSGLDSIYNIIREFISSMAQTSPNTSVLEFGSATDERLVSVLSSQLSIADDSFDGIDFVFTSETTESLKKAESHLSPCKNLMKAQKLAIDDGYDIQGFQKNSFDIIVLSRAFATEERLNKALDIARVLLKPGGKICLVSIQNPSLLVSLISRCVAVSPSKDKEHLCNGDLEEKTTEAVFQRHGIMMDYQIDPFESLQDERLSITFGTGDTACKENSGDQDVVILQAAQPSKLAQTLVFQLASDLDRSGAKTRIVSWSTDISCLEIKDCISLLELDTPLLLDLSSQDFTKLRQLVLQSSNLLWVSALDDPTIGLAFGMARSIRNELPGQALRNLLVRGKSLQSPQKLAALITRIATKPTWDNEFEEVDGKIQTSRIVDDAKMNQEMSRWLGGGTDTIEHVPLESMQGSQELAIQTRGMLDSLFLKDDESTADLLGHDEIEIMVEATGLNFRDVMVTMGQIPDRLLGFEASGTVARLGKDVKHFKVGDAVCTLGHGAHRTLFRNKASLCQMMPSELSFEEASTLPLVHCTAFYALMHVSRPRKGQTILIHAAAGGVGQAAIQIANNLGLEIFATVSSPDKKQLIKDNYGVSDDHIFNSRDLSFAKGIKRMTQGRGVDIILNSLSGEALRQTWYCIAPFGTFVEIGMKDILGNMRLEMRPFLQDATFTFFNLKHIMADNLDLMADIMEGTFKLLYQGITTPVSPVTVYSIADVEKAFRLMQTGKHRGKIALNWNRKDIVPALPSSKLSVELDPQATYVLVGGLGGLGRSLANLLVELGARCLCFLSRSGDGSRTARQVVQELREKLVRTKVYSCDVADKDRLSEVIQDCKRDFPPIKGVFQCAVALHDSLFEKMTHQQWRDSLRPKVQGSWNLHSLLPKDLDFFIALSSFVGIFGNRGQSNYAAANAYMDALASYRRSLGLKAVTIDLGIMRDVGLLAGGGATGSVKEWEEPFGIREHEFLLTMKYVIATELNPAQQTTPQILTGFATGGTAQAAGIRRPYYFDDARFSILAKTGLTSQSGETASSTAAIKNVPLKDQLAHVGSYTDAMKAVLEAMIARVAKSLQADRSEIDERRPLYSYGIDSLVAVEIVNWVFKETKVTLSVLDILASMPITSLVHNVTHKSPFLAAELKVGV